MSVSSDETVSTDHLGADERRALLFAEKPERAVCYAGQRSEGKTRIKCEVSYGRAGETQLVRCILPRTGNLRLRRIALPKGAGSFGRIALPGDIGLS